MLDSMQHHLVADVPVGVFLSAGIDSNAIAALAAELGTQLRTVTLAFDEYAGTPDDEAPLAEAAAKILRSDHVTVRIGRGEFEQLLDDFLACMDQPTIDGLNTYLVSRAAATQGLKVALSGVGGDELFGGYPSFSQIPEPSEVGTDVALPSPWAVRLGPFACDVAAGYSAQGCGAAFVFRRCRECLSFAARPHLEDELDTLLDESWLEQGLERLSTCRAITQTVEPLRARAQPSMHRSPRWRSCWYMRNQLLRDTDWSSMAHGLEVRVPFVDATLLELWGLRSPPNPRPENEILGRVRV